MQKEIKNKFNVVYNKIIAQTHIEKEDIADLIRYWYIIGCWHSFDASRSSCECFRKIVNSVYNKTTNIMQSDSGRNIIPTASASPATKNAVRSCVHSVCLNICSRARDDRSVLCKEPFGRINQTSKHILDHGVFARLAMYQLIIEQACVASCETVSLFAQRTFFTNKCLYSNMPNFYVNEDRVKSTHLSKIGIHEALYHSNTESIKHDIYDIVEGVIYSGYALRCSSHHRPLGECHVCAEIVEDELTNEIYGMLVRCGSSWYQHRDQQNLFHEQTICTHCLTLASSARRKNTEVCISRSKNYFSNLGSAVVFFADVILAKTVPHGRRLLEIDSLENMKYNLDDWYLPCLSPEKREESDVKYPPVSYHTKLTDPSFRQGIFDYPRDNEPSFSPKKYEHTQKSKSLHFYSGVIRKERDCEG